MDGVLLVNKEKDMTSHDVIYKLRKILKTKKIGHCGTLDPMATGVLVCLVNKATKLSNYLVLDTKEYIATFKLGISTTTQDNEGEVVEKKEYKNDIEKEDILVVLKKYTGDLIQTPSIYSAIKVNGKKLYEYARNNEEVEIPQRNITIFSNELLNINNDEITIKVKCSSGTYIRTLCYDIAKELGYPGVLIKLERTQSGKYNIEDTHTLNEIAEGNYKLLSIGNALDGYDKMNVSDKEYQDVLNGKVLQCEMANDFIVEYNNEVIALYNASVDGCAKMKRGLW